MKAYTDIEQSRKLAEILPLESADMCWVTGEIEPLWGVIKSEPDDDFDVIPSWSLAALLEVLPEGAIMPYYVPCLQKEDGKYSVAYGDDELLCEANNPIDACVEMILKLHEEKMVDPEFNIEIPFGANDSELQEVSYYIPEGFNAEIKDDRVVIKKVEPKFKAGDFCL